MQLVNAIAPDLVRNAIRYTHAGTPVAIVALRLGEHMQVRVEDRGPGVPPTLATLAAA